MTRLVCYSFIILCWLLYLEVLNYQFSPCNTLENILNIVY